jgi:hypothetical protein
MPPAGHWLALQCTATTQERRVQLQHSTLNKLHALSRIHTGALILKRAGQYLHTVCSTRGP